MLTKDQLEQLGEDVDTEFDPEGFTLEVLCLVPKTEGSSPEQHYLLTLNGHAIGQFFNKSCAEVFAVAIEKLLESEDNNNAVIDRETLN